MRKKNSSKYTNKSFLLCPRYSCEQKNNEFIIKEADSESINDFFIGKKDFCGSGKERKFKDINQIDNELLINIFKSEYFDWFLYSNKDIYPIESPGFHINELIALKICISYPESFGKLMEKEYRKSKSNNKHFIIGCNFLGVGGNNEKLIKDFYKNVRCGLFHIGSLEGNWYIDYEENELSENIIYYKGKDKCINVIKFIKRIKTKLNEYTQKLYEYGNEFIIFKINYIHTLEEYFYNQGPGSVI